MPDPAGRPSLAEQLGLFPLPIDLEHRPAMFKGWMACDCGLVFWLWPVGSGLSPAHDTGVTGAPDLRRFEPWTCWRGIRRMSPQPRHRRKIANA